MPVTHRCGLALTVVQLPGIPQTHSTVMQEPKRPSCWQSSLKSIQMELANAELQAETERVKAELVQAHSVIRQAKAELVQAHSMARIGAKAARAALVVLEPFVTAEGKGCLAAIQSLWQLDVPTATHGNDPSVARLYVSSHGSCRRSEHLGLECLCEA